MLFIFHHVILGDGDVGEYDSRSFLPKGNKEAFSYDRDRYSNQKQKRFSFNN